jgi:hypothetical protein
MKITTLELVFILNLTKKKAFPKKAHGYLQTSWQLMQNISEIGFYRSFGNRIDLKGPLSINAKSLEKQTFSRLLAVYTEGVLCIVHAHQRCAT